MTRNKYGRLPVWEWCVLAGLGLALPLLSAARALAGRVPRRPWRLRREG